MPQEHSTWPAAPAIKKIDLTIARLRLLLADITARETTATGDAQTRTSARFLAPVPAEA